MKSLAPQKHKSSLEFAVRHGSKNYKIIVKQHKELSKLKVYKIKKHLSRTTGIPIEEQILIHANQELDDSDNLEKHGIQQGSIILLVTNTDNPEGTHLNGSYDTKATSASNLSAKPSSFLDVTDNRRNSADISTLSLINATQTSEELATKPATHQSFNEGTRRSPGYSAMYNRSPTVSPGTKRNSLRLSGLSDTMWRQSPQKASHQMNSWQDEKSKILRQWAQEKKQILVRANEDREHLMKENQRLRKELNVVLPLSRKQSPSPFTDLYREDLEKENSKLTDKIESLEKELKEKTQQNSKQFVENTPPPYRRNSSRIPNPILEDPQQEWDTFQTSPTRPPRRPSLPPPRLSDTAVNIEKEDTKEEYERKIKHLQEKLEKLKLSMEEKEKDWQHHFNMLNAQIKAKDGEEVLKLKAEWEKERESILQNWREETDILKMIWKEDKESWSKERSELQQKQMQELQNLSENHKASMLDAEKSLSDKESQIHQLKIDMEEMQKQVEEAQAQTEKDKLHVESANSALDELRKQIERITSDQGFSRALVEVTHQKNMEQKKVENLSKTLDALRAKLQKETSRRKALHSTIEDLKGNIRVIVRLRPWLQNERKDAAASFSAFPDAQIEVSDDTTVSVTTGSMGRKKSEFFRALGPSASQQEVFEELKPLIQSACDGFNICVMAYGQTGTGKTYTIHGDSESAKGVVPRAVEDLFATLNSDAETNYTIKCSMVELYMDKLNDLLSGESSNSLEIRQTPGNGTTIQGITTHLVRSSQELLAMLFMGTSLRQTHSTAMNERSSRSHTLFIVNLEIKNKRSKTVTRSKMTFVDLAGSERVSKSHSTGERFKEAQHINSSLSALGDVISNLSRGKRTYVPYRNSKLTMLLQDSIGGNSKTVLFANISPDTRSISETLSTLQFASRVKCVRNPFVRNAFRSNL